MAAVAGQVDKHSKLVGRGRIMAKNNLMKYVVIGVVGYLGYQMALRGSLGSDMQGLATDAKGMFGVVGKQALGDGTSTRTGNNIGSGVTGTWSFNNGVWSNTNGARAYVQQESDGTYTAVYQNPSGGYSVINNASHVSQPLAENVVNSFVH